MNTDTDEAKRERLRALGFSIREHWSGNIYRRETWAAWFSWITESEAFAWLARRDAEEQRRKEG